MFKPARGFKSQCMLLLEHAHLVPVCNDGMCVLLPAHTGKGEQKPSTLQLFLLPLTYYHGVKIANYSSSSFLESSSNMSPGLFNYFCLLMCLNCHALPGMYQALGENALDWMNSDPPNASRCPYVILSHPPQQNHTKGSRLSLPMFEFLLP